jgi:hypothetical protein
MKIIKFKSGDVVTIGHYLHIGDVTIKSILPPCKQFPFSRATFYGNDIVCNVLWLILTPSVTLEELWNDLVYA